MTQIPILNGIFTDGGADFRTFYPVNLVPVPKENGISKGYLRPADGIVNLGSMGNGVDRGGINWNGVCYRVAGTKLVRIPAGGGSATTLGDVGGTGLVTMDYGFDRLAIASGGNLFYWDGAALTQVTDPDLGTAVDVRWIDGYFMTTDGSNLVVTELTDPTQVNPLKYGSSEVDPDPILALLRIRKEIHAVNRYTIESFDNIGGDFFPFQRIEGSQISKGAIGTHACCVYMDAIAFVGSGRNESPGIYLGQNATAVKISTREIDTLLLSYTEAELAAVKVESRNDRANQHLYIHLPDRTIVFDAEASQVMGESVWFVLTSSTVGFSRYRAINFVWCYDEWIVGDPEASRYGRMDSTHGHQWNDEHVRWEFGTTITYNGSRGAIFHELELVALTGSVDLWETPRIATSYSTDGITWSQDRWINAGLTGNRAKRLVWRQQGLMRNWRIQRFRGDSSAHLTFARLEAQVEPLVA